MFFFFYLHDSSKSTRNCWIVPLGLFYILHLPWTIFIRNTLKILLTISSKAGERIRGRPEGSLFNSYYTEELGRALLLSLDCSTTLDTYVLLFSVKQGGIKYYFKVFWYDANWDWTQVSRTIGEHSFHSANVSNNFCENVKLLVSI